MMPQTPKVKRKVALPAYSHTQSLSVVAVLTISLSTKEEKLKLRCKLYVTKGQVFNPD